MKSPLSLLAVAVLAAFTTGVALAQGVSITPRKAREPSLALAAKIAAYDGVAEPLTGEPPNPLVPLPAVPVAEPENLPPPSNRADQLKRAIDALNPSGTVELGADRFVLLARKRYKVGDLLPLSIDGQNLEAFIEKVEPTTFSVRLGDAVYTRSTRSNTR